MTQAATLDHSRLASEAQQYIDEALSASAGQVCVTSSFQAECVALVHMLVQRRPEIPVLFLDTGYHFPETLEYRDRIAAALHLNLVNLLPKLTVTQQESQFGILYQSEPDRCCAMRKVEPLFAALEAYDTWFTGLRREQSKTRAQLRPIDDFRLPTGKVLRKVSPLADWSAREVWGYLRESGIPTLPLYERGYASIGCAPCTSLPVDPDDPRSGRWAGRKLECGIHIQR
jgi:phosphoadenosine phosphosulfate reductase